MRGVLLSVGVVAMLAPALPRLDTVEAWMRAGDRAAQQGHWAEAVTWYEKAEATPLDPGRVAFNLATARYHLATQGQLRELSAAEAGYRACLSGERRGRAFLGLGNCLLLRATVSDNPDAALLRAAIDQFQAAEQADATVAPAARYNRARARLLLLQVLPSFQESEPADASEPPAADEPREETHPPPAQPQPKGPDSGDSSSGSQRQPSKDGQEAPVIEEKNRPAAPGAGAATPLPNRPEAALVAAEEALQALRQATQRILEESRANRRARLVPRSGPGADW